MAQPVWQLPAGGNGSTHQGGITASLLHSDTLPKTSTVDSVGDRIMRYRDIFDVAKLFFSSHIMYVRKSPETSMETSESHHKIKFGVFVALFSLSRRVYSKLSPSFISPADFSSFSMY